MLSATVEVIRRQYQLITLLEECRNEWQGLAEDAFGLLQRMAANIGSQMDMGVGDSTFIFDGQLPGESHRTAQRAAATEQSG
ncbi:hypothetical protein [Candidatus Poriferisodalis sp.]|uniref:hypothetical protein n=1 Tax=Candidatus Poriferisodalis sp. TaxID=3101277 RepID=UPI003B02CAC6